MHLKCYQQKRDHFIQASLYDHDLQKYVTMHSSAHKLADFQHYAHIFTKHDFMLAFNTPTVRFIISYSFYYIL